MLHDSKAVKYSPAVTPDIKKALYHPHGERFSKPAGTGKKRDNVICIIDQLIEHLSLINVIAVSFAELIEILTANK
jgi:hypothetical protein